MRILNAVTGIVVAHNLASVRSSEPVNLPKHGAAAVHLGSAEHIVTHYLINMFFLKDFPKRVSQESVK